MMTVVSMIPRQRAAILTAAREAFARRGFTGASMQDIARSASLSPGMLHSYFKTKKDLFNAVVDQVWAVALADIEAAVWDARTPEVRLQTFIEIRQGMVERMIRDLRITTAALRDILPLVEPCLAGPRARELALLEAIFEEGRVRRSFAVHNPRATARALAAGLHQIECTMVRFCLMPGLRASNLE
ncbi:TetR/AcrR family transcriptional regulator [Corallococcus terminator]